MLLLLLLFKSNKITFCYFNQKWLVLDYGWLANFWNARSSLHETKYV